MKKIIGAIAALSLLVPFVSFADSTVTASADSGSYVTPSGSITISTGSDQVFGIGAFAGNEVTGVYFDGANQGVVSSFDVTEDGADHTLSVTSKSLGGGTMPYCSGPMAPGWNVSLPGGGCGSTSVYVQYNKPLADGTLCQYRQGCIDLGKK